MKEFFFVCACLLFFFWPHHQRLLDMPVAPPEQRRYNTPMENENAEQAYALMHGTAVVAPPPRIASLFCMSAVELQLLAEGGEAAAVRELERRSDVLRELLYTVEQAWCDAPYLTEGTARNDVCECVSGVVDGRHHHESSCEFHVAYVDSSED